MDRSWLWRFKSSEKSFDVAEGSEPVFSLSEKFSDDQEPYRSSPTHVSSPDFSSLSIDEPHDSMKILAEKLQAAFFNIKAKEELVRKHAKVADEAVTGWEKAEKDVLALKNQLEAANRKNLALEESVEHLDGALKECLKNKLSNSKDKSESFECAFQIQISEYQKQLESAKTAHAPGDVDLKHKFEILERENYAIKQELQTLLKELEFRTLERNLSAQAAESASKRHLESEKKVAKLDAECRQLQAMIRKSFTLAIEHNTSVSFCVESFSLPGSGERRDQIDSEIHKIGSGELNDCDTSFSDTLASSLKAELGHIKNERAGEKKMMANCIEIDLFDDFLEMEKLAALSENEDGRLNFKEKSVLGQPQTHNTIGLSSEMRMVERIDKLEHDLAREVREKEIVETSLSELKADLERSKLQLIATEEKLAALHSEVNSVNVYKVSAEAKAKSDNDEKVRLVQCLENADIELHTLEAKIVSLELDTEERKTLAVKLENECQYLKDEMEKENELSANMRSRCKDLEMEVEQLSKLSRELSETCENLEAESAQYKVLCGEMDSRCVNLEAVLEQERTSLTKIKDRYQILETEINQERASLALAKSRCHALEEKLAQRNQETLKQPSFSSNGEFKSNQEKEFAVAAKKLAECQRTIASLGHQLKSLASLDDLLLDD